MTKYTFTREMAAHYGDRDVLVPDQVADDQRAYDGKTFPAILLRSTWEGGRKRIRVRLDGAAYGLNTPGTGDMVVRSA